MIRTEYANMVHVHGGGQPRHHAKGEMAMRGETVVFLIDDHALFRAGVALLMRDLIGEPRVVEFASASAALTALLAGPPPGLVLLDLHLPDESGLDGLERIKEAFPALPVVVLSSDDRKETILDAFERGASGFVPKSCPTDEFEAALVKVLAGELYVPAQAVSGGAFPEQLAAPAEALPPLTERERSVLECLMRGMTNKQICRALGIAEPTARQHTRTIFDAFKVQNRAQVISAAIRCGLRCK